MRRFKREDYSRPDYMLQYHDLRNTLFFGEVFDTRSRLAGAKLSWSIFLFCDLRKAQIQDTDVRKTLFIFCLKRGCNFSNTKRRWIKCLG